MVAAVSHPIREHLADKGGTLPPDTRFERIGGGSGWSMIREIGAQARAGMIADGIRAYVSVRQRGDGAWTYAIGRVSPFIPFDVLAILRELNAVEDPERGTWGGSNLVGGSPRLKGSRLKPEDVTRIINRIVTGSVPTSSNPSCGVAASLLAGTGRLSLSHRVVQESNHHEENRTDHKQYQSPRPVRRARIASLGK